MEFNKRNLMVHVIFERGPQVLGNFDLSTPNLVHLWKSMNVIRWHMSLRDRVHVLCTCTIHMHRHLYFRETLS